MLHSELDELHHYGVLGMKWGIRKNRRAPSDTAAPKPRGVDERKLELDHINTYRNRDKVSTRKLQSLKNRMQVEADLERLVYAKERARKEMAEKQARDKREKRVKYAKMAIAAVSNVPLDKFINVNPDDYEGGIDNPFYKQDVNTAKNLRDGLGFTIKTTKSVLDGLDGGGGKKK